MRQPFEEFLSRWAFTVCITDNNARRRNHFLVAMRHGKFWLSSLLIVNNFRAGCCWAMLMMMMLVYMNWGQRRPWPLTNMHPPPDKGQQRVIYADTMEYLVLKIYIYSLALSCSLSVLIVMVYNLLQTHTVCVLLRIKKGFSTGRNIYVDDDDGKHKARKCMRTRSCTRAHSPSHAQTDIYI